MSLGLFKFEILIGGQYSLWLPDTGVPLRIQKNEFNLLVNNLDDARPLYMTQAFTIPIEKNEKAIAAIKSGITQCQIKINNVIMLTGRIQTYSEDLSPTGTKQLSVSVVSAFKDMVDYMGDNVLYLDKYNFIGSSANPTIVNFNSQISDDLLKFARYLPINKVTGNIAYSPENVNDYCQPSLCLVEFFKRVFAANGWSANWDFFNAPAKSGDSYKIIPKNICLTPTKNYLASSFGFAIQNYSVIIPANGSVKLPLTASNLSWNQIQETTGCTPVGDGTVTVTAPNRLMQFKTLGSYNSTLPVTFVVTDGTEIFSTYDSVGATAIRNYSDWVNPSEGLDPVYVELRNYNSTDVTFSADELYFYNLFFAYETDQLGYFWPDNCIYPISDNFEDVTILDLFKNFLVLLQVAFSSDDEAKTINFYYINNILDNPALNVNASVLWGGYVSLGANLEGLGVLNVIRYKEGERRQIYFKTDLPNLPAKEVYHESLFLQTEDDKAWGAMVVPNGEYQVKTVDGVPSEYLKYKKITPVIGYYLNTGGVETMNFEPISLGNIAREFWSNILALLSTQATLNPTVFELEISAGLYDFLQAYQQRNLFFYQANALLVGGEYDVLQHKFIGRFLSLQ